MSQNSFKELIIPTTKNHIKKPLVLGPNLESLSFTEFHSRNSPALNINVYQNFNFSPLSKLGQEIPENSLCSSPEPRLYSPIFQHFSKQSTLQENNTLKVPQRNLRDEYQQNFLKVKNNPYENKFSIFKNTLHPLSPAEKQEEEVKKENNWEGFLNLAIKVFSGENLNQSDLDINQYELEAVNYVLH